jgi:hypothetical protein
VSSTPPPPPLPLAPSPQTTASAECCSVGWPVPCPSLFVIIASHVEGAGNVAIFNSAKLSLPAHCWIGRDDWFTSPGWWCNGSMLSLGLQGERGVLPMLPSGGALRPEASLSRGNVGSDEFLFSVCVVSGSRLVISRFTCRASLKFIILEFRVGS